MTREGVGVREWKKERKVQIQAVGKEPNLLCKKNPNRRCKNPNRRRHQVPTSIFLTGLPP